MHIARKLWIIAPTLLAFSGTAQAQCTPEGNARLNAAGRRELAAAARIRAGDCSAVADWRRALAAQHAILRRSQQQTYPYTCNVTIKYPSPPPCKSTDTAKKAEAKKQAAKAEPASPPAAAAKAAGTASNPAAKPASCSDITGTNSSAQSATHCKDADRALYAARQIRQNNPQLAAAEYKKAAAAAQRAGDSNLELSILREMTEAAGTIIAAVPPGAAATSGTTVTPTVPAQPAVNAVPRMWDGTWEKCETANKLERATAGWYDMCMKPALPPKRESEHRPSPDPLELHKQARQACGSYTAKTQRCFSEFKLKVILEKNGWMREACEKWAQGSGLRRRLREQMGMGADRQKFLECVDNAYLYGDLDGSANPNRPTESLRDQMKKAMAAKAAQAGAAQPPAAQPANSAGLPSGPCQRGYGVKPLPNAFGAWGCQPLGLLMLDSSRPRLDPKEEAERIEDVEERIDEAVANAVASAVAVLGPAMPASEREVCLAASLAAVRSVLKGGAPDVPEQCRTMANMARAHLALYANAHVDNSNTEMEDLLASFSGDLGAPAPGMTGLTPDERLQRIGECLLRGGTAESCN